MFGLVCLLINGVSLCQKQVTTAAVGLVYTEYSEGRSDLLILALNQLKGLLKRLKSLHVVFEFILHFSFHQHENRIFPNYEILTDSLVELIACRFEVISFYRNQRVHNIGLLILRVHFQDSGH